MWAALRRLQMAVEGSKIWRGGPSRGTPTRCSCRMSCLLQLAHNSIVSSPPLTDPLQQPPQNHQLGHTITQCKNANTTHNPQWLLPYNIHIDSHISKCSALLCHQQVWMWSPWMVTPTYTTTTITIPLCIHPSCLVQQVYNVAMVTTANASANANIFTTPLQWACQGGNGMLATSSISPAHLSEDLAGKDNIGSSASVLH